MEKIRINKYLSQIGYCSRRKADQLILENKITINGKVPEMGTKIDDTDVIAVDGKVIQHPKETPRIYLAFNKPVGIVCTSDAKREKNNIIDFINYPERIFYAGRLDKNSEGLMLLTNDGDIVNKIMRARNKHEKEYIVTVNKEITDDFIQKMGNGVPILDTISRKCKVERIDSNSFRIILTQGLNRQIRRMCEYFDYRVEKLIRKRIMNIELDLPTGKWRELRVEELETLKRLIG